MEPRFLIYDGSQLSGPVYRIVGGCPPTTDDFRSYYELGRAFRSYQLFRATGVSVFESLAGALAANAKYMLGTHIAELDVRDNRIFWAPTGSEGHLTVWATPGVLLNHVTSCAEEGAWKEGNDVRGTRSSKP